MVDWNSPQTLIAGDLVLVKLFHLIDGVYIWEYFSTLWFEWQVFTKKQPWRWSMLIYFGTRIAALAGVCTQIVGFNLTTRFDCQAWLQTVLSTCYLAYSLNSLLLLLRTVIIWDRRPIIAIGLSAVWLTNVAFLIYGISIAKGVWVPSETACFVVNSQNTKLNILVSAATDFILLFAMIIGVIRLESDSSIWYMLYRQGMVWIALAAVGLVPPTTFLFLNLNEPMNLMFQSPAMIIMTICATRLYRSLMTFGGVRRPAAFDSFLSSAPMASIQPIPRGVRLPQHLSGGTPSLSTGSGTTVTNVSLEVEFPTSYGRYRAEDLEMVNDRLKAIDEDSEECGDKTKGAC